MFAVAPSGGNANLSEAQRALLAGKARWIRAAWEAGLPTIPTILITRAAWDALQAERRHSENRLRAHWVATLFRLVGRDGRPPPLVVRTATDRALPGLAPARAGLPAPATEAEAVDPARPLGRAIADAFKSYPDGEADEIVLIQAVAQGEIIQFLSRDPQSGAIGPAPLPGGAVPLAPEASELSEAMDRVAARHMRITASAEKGSLTFLSARPYQAAAAA
jgi:pyruvate,orthophosphate dikinase